MRSWKHWPVGAKSAHFVYGIFLKIFQSGKHTKPTTAWYLHKTWSERLNFMKILFHINHNSWYFIFRKEQELLSLIANSYLNNSDMET